MRSKLNIFVILSEAKDLLSLALTRKQIFRFAQDDNPNLWNARPYSPPKNFRMRSSPRSSSAFEVA